MKHINKNIIILPILLILLYYILTHSIMISINIYESLNMFITKVFPFLFPSIVLTNLLILNNFPYYLSKYFKIKAPTYIFIMSLITGCPSNAIMIKNLLNKNDIDIETAEKILCCTLFNNPIFLYNNLLLSFNKYISIKIIIINYIVSFLIFILLNKNNNHIEIKYIQNKFSNTIVTSIQNAINTLLMIMGTIIFFNMFSINSDILKGLIELTKGLNILPNLNIINHFKIFLAALYISFSGLCILLQIKSILADTSIKFKYFFKYRLIHLILVMLLNHMF